MSTRKDMDDKAGDAERREGDARPYWHEISDEAYAALLAAEPPILWSDVVARFKQPDWCTHHEALSGVLGCWTLTGVKGRKLISVGYCGRCECFAPFYDLDSKSTPPRGGK